MSRNRTIVDGPRRIVVVVCEKGEDPVAAVTEAARDAGIRAAQVSGVGALRSAQLGYFDAESHEYVPIAVSEQVEVLSLLGDVATKDGEPVLHAHAVLGRRTGEAIGGHLMSAEVWPTLEVVVSEVAPELAKQVDPETGLALIVP